jgi:hypothetical protein
LQPAVERVGHGDQLHLAPGRIHRLLYGLRTAAAAADKADLDGVAAVGVRPAGDLHLTGGNGRSGDKNR